MKIPPTHIDRKKVYKKVQVKKDDVKVNVDIDNCSYVFCLVDNKIKKFKVEKVFVVKSKTGKEIIKHKLLLLILETDIIPYSYYDTYKVMNENVCFATRDQLINNLIK
jgi:hypothetical protein